MVVAVVSVVGALATLAALVWALQLRRALASATVQNEALADRVSALDENLATEGVRAAAAEEAAAAARADGTREAERARIAEERVTAESERADVEASRAADALASAEAAEARAVAALDATAEAIARAERAEQSAAVANRSGDGGGVAAGAALALDLRRVERLWRDRLALLPDDPSPFDGAADPIAVAVGVFAEASREESGVVIDVAWSLDPLDDPATALVVLRTAEELVAAARASDGGELEVRAGDDGAIVLRLVTEPAITPEPTLSPDLFALGVHLTPDPPTLTAHLPPSPPSPPPPEL